MRNTALCCFIGALLIAVIVDWNGPNSVTKSIVCPVVSCGDTTKPVICRETDTRSTLMLSINSCKRIWASGASPTRTIPLP